MDSEQDGNPVAWESERLIAQRLGREHAALLQNVFVAAADYFQRFAGVAGPDADAAERELEACTDVEGREVVVLIDTATGEPVGALGWWRGNPEPDVTLLGMLVVVPTRRGEGLAREAVRGLEEWLIGRGVRRLRTAVSARHYSEHRLVSALGFTQMSIRDHTALGLGGSHLALFEKPIS